eukprot:15074852-Alexandrium_andersonii.AAC.1
MRRPRQSRQGAAHPVERAGVARCPGSTQAAPPAGGRPPGVPRPSPIGHRAARQRGAPNNERA